jgi:hypothetical protein
MAAFFPCDLLGIALVPHYLAKLTTMDLSNWAAVCCGSSDGTKTAAGLYLVRTNDCKAIHILETTLSFMNISTEIMVEELAPRIRLAGPA